jgi:hypothetical protein
MKKLLTLADTTASLDPRYRFGVAWLAAFLGFVLIIGTVLVFMMSGNG